MMEDIISSLKTSNQGALNDIFYIMEHPGFRKLAPFLKEWK
jgi:hypothetical protein